MKETILSISGKPGLYRLVSQGRGNLIVETVDAAKNRMPISMRDRVTSINDISMYTDDEDMPLMQIFDNIYKQLEGKASELNHKTATSEQLAQFMEMALPSYDRDRVYNSDIKKLLQWYNILVNNGYTEFVDAEEEEANAETEENKAE